MAPGSRKYRIEILLSGDGTRGVLPWTHNKVYTSYSRAVAAIKRYEDER